MDDCSPLPANEIEIYGVECVRVTRVSRAAVYSTAPVSIINDGSECQYDSAVGEACGFSVYAFRRHITQTDGLII